MVRYTLDQPGFNVAIHPRLFDFRRKRLILTVKVLSSTKRSSSHKARKIFHDLKSCRDFSSKYTAGGIRFAKIDAFAIDIHAAVVDIEGSNRYAPTSRCCFLI